MTINNFIREKRENSKITQEKLAKMAGISKRTLCRLEAEVGTMELQSILKICEILQISVKIDGIELVSKKNKKIVLKKLDKFVNIS